MADQLSISIGQCSDKGRKLVNQDFHGALMPTGPALALKGISVVLTDGISSSRVSQVAAQSMVKSFLSDYYATSESWSVKTSALRVIRAANSWLFAQTQRSIHADNMDHGYVCTLSALVLKARTAHIFHVGDSRVYRLQGKGLEPLTTDHRTVVSSAQSYLARAIGMAATVDVDYRAVPLRVGDVFLLATDGVFEHISPPEMVALIREHGANLDSAARAIVAAALAHGSPDNLTLQILRIETLPERGAEEVMRDSAALPVPPLLEAGQVFEGFKVLRALHSTHRSHVYLVEDEAEKTRLALKIPSVAMREDQAALARFMMEDWIARRVKSAHLLQAAPRTRPRRFIYTASEYIEGQTLAQWMIDHPKCDLETMRGLIEQVAKGLRAMHRKEMLHQDLRPENIMIDRTGTVKIIDFGAVVVAGLQEVAPLAGELQGTQQYTAPECFLGAPCSRESDMFSLGVIAYQLLTGGLPYGAQVARLHSPAQLRRLAYRRAENPAHPIPDWVDGALQKAVHPQPGKRYETLSHLVADLATPNPAFSQSRPRPWAEKNPLAFWQGLAALLALMVLGLLVLLVQPR